MTTTITRVERPAGAHPAAVYGQDEAGNYYTDYNGEWWPENEATKMARKTRAAGKPVYVSTPKGPNGTSWTYRKVA